MLDDWSVAQKARKKRLFLALAGRRFLAGAARVHCTAEAELAQAAKFLRPGSGIVISLLVDLAPYANLPGPELALGQFPQIGGEGPRLLFLSRLGHHAALLRPFQRLEPAHDSPVIDRLLVDLGPSPPALRPRAKRSVAESPPRPASGRGGIGIVGIARDGPGPLLRGEQRRLLDALTDQGALALALGETDADGAVLGETDGEPVLTVPHEIATTSVKSASDFIIGCSSSVGCLLGA